MRVHEVTEQNKFLYNDFITKNNGSFLQSWEWGDWQVKNGKRVVRYFITDGSEKPIFSAQFMRQPLPFGQEYLYCPYGPTTRDKGQGTREVLDTLIDQVRKEFTKTLFVRLEPTFPLPATSYSLQPTLHIQPGSTILLNISQGEDALLANMHAKTRYNIRVAERHGVIVKTLEARNDRALAARMMRDTLVRRKLASPAENYYAALMNHFGSDSNIHTSTYGAYYNNELIACALALDFGSTRTYLFGGSGTTHKNVMAPYLLHWTIIKDAQKKGLVTYDWFGAEGAVSDGSGFARFKQSFGGEIKQYAGAFDIIFKSLSYKAYQATRRLNRWVKHH